MLTAYVITQTYQNGDLGSAKQLLEHIFDIDSVLDTEEVEERVRYKLSIVKDFDADIAESYVEELTEFLVEIGVIKMIVHDDYSIDMYEVKRSSGKSEVQYKWLVDKEFNEYIEAMWGGRIRNRTVLYLGEDDSVMVNGMEIRYKNMNQFLKA